MKNRFTPKARKENLVVQEAEKEILIYDLDSNKAFCLNETSALIWQACNGNNDVSEITSIVGKQLSTSVNDDFVWLALDQLKKDNLIENKDEFTADFNGMSRRDVIKKVGLASVVSLPLIASLVAPPAAYALSCDNSACSCAGDGSFTGNGQNRVCNNDTCPGPAGCRCRGVGGNGTGGNCLT